MTLEQPTQQVFEGVIVGFLMVVNGMAPTEPQRRKYDTHEEMYNAHARLQDVALTSGWDEPIPCDFFVRFKTETGEEEEVDIYVYHIPNLTKGNPAKKVLCKCGTVAWRIGKAERLVDVPLFVCDDCRDQDSMDEVVYLKEIDADPRDHQ